MTKNRERLNTYLIPGAFLVLFVGGLGGWFWWSSRQFEHPADHWIAKANGKARTWADDAELSVIEGYYVRPDGVADLPNPGDSGWRLVFRSEALASGESSPPAESTIPGAPPSPSTPKYACFAYTVGRGSARSRNLVRTNSAPVRCPEGLKQQSSEPPRCSVEEVWRRAEQRGAPNPGLATVAASVQGDEWRWSFRIPDHVEFEILDDC
ncbi:hypothetical protein ENSA5_36250 [Enhygromyxa salina]|uniref:Uncharacterized protein n=1 Tax=Enhygromyxa salina TaxID=215803 RepID=A0A2S9XUJ6_9BACT|nr:hypothetical protein [Enhygromyxa salina]PRP96549.1 hypothetical protein ENSA5_36250 [Enhygromyxa salina]